jgi:DNA-binding helix-hairpin-helix protein with protein kinase domain
MTTKPSSSRHASPTLTLYDALSNPVRLGTELGRGGEGSVYEVAGEASLVAKVYHKTPLTMDHVTKLEAMASRWSESLETISAWPRSMLFDMSHRKPCGILMNKMVGARPLHELYGTTNRRRHFPEVGWHHLVLAARNTAAAFHTMHATHIVVGDVNQGNLLVDKDMRVRLIDCDSFQIARDGKTYNCPVGTPHFTPPELQNLKLREVLRSVNHDRFGMAILIFHLLFVGRHPFAGRYHGVGDLSIEKAIAERRFAFSHNKRETLVDPPPASLLLDELPPEIANLFEAAFRGGMDGGSEETSRPSPQMWVEQLDALLKRRKQCSFDPSHIYFAQLNKCPWCRIEDAGGPSFFVSGGGTTIISANRLTRLDDRVRELREVPFPELLATRIALPTMPVLKRPKERPKRTWLDTSAAAFVVGLLTCFVGAFYSPWALVAGAVMSTAAAAYLLASKEGKVRRKTVVDFRDWLKKSHLGLARHVQAILMQDEKRRQAFAESTDDLRTEIRRFQTEPADLKKVIIEQGSEQKAEFLRGYLLRDDYRRIPGLTASHVSLMESFGVESANDVDRLQLYGIPNIDNELMMELLQWRGQVESKFVFNPEHGVTVAELKKGGEAAVRKFKVTQARKILTGAEQLQNRAFERKAELTQVLGQFDDQTNQWMKVAKQLRDYENGRRPLERLVNYSLATILGPAIGVPALAGILYLIFGR